MLYGGWCSIYVICGRVIVTGLTFLSWLLLCFANSVTFTNHYSVKRRVLSMYCSVHSTTWQLAVGYSLYCSNKYKLSSTQHQMLNG